MRNESPAVEISTEELEEGLSAEKQQEQQLMSKLQNQGKLPARPASNFLQKKLQQRKFFDSGDYAMDKSKQAAAGPPKPHPLAAPNQPIPKPKVVSPIGPPPKSPEPSDVLEEGLTIPRPDNVPQRKASIINPGMHSKLSPQPLIHHESHSEMPEV
ncbi:unnamed protein product, partial [Mesorhabditis belari]|uniref:cAMP-regulated phosphoprotein 19 n=1 Tax=Mesorhabditis belari TaxID=2138241 RepID=A0AAF3J7L7_9BILA